MLFIKAIFSALGISNRLQAVILLVLVAALGAVGTTAHVRGKRIDSLNIELGKLKKSLEAETQHVAERDAAIDLQNQALEGLKDQAMAAQKRAEEAIKRAREQSKVDYARGQGVLLVKSTGDSCKDASLLLDDAIHSLKGADQ